MRRVTLVRCTHARGSLNKPFLLCGQLCGTDRLVPGGDTKGSCFVAPEPQPVFPRGTALRTQCRATRGPLSPTTHKASWGGSRPAHTVLPPGTGARSPQFPRTALGALMRPGQPGNLASNPETHSGPARLSDIHKASARMRFCHLRHPAARWPAAPELCPGPPRVSLHLTADGTQVTRSITLVLAHRCGQVASRPYRWQEVLEVSFSRAPTVTRDVFPQQDCWPKACASSTRPDCLSTERAAQLSQTCHHVPE